MTDVIDFFFKILATVWSLMCQYWFLSATVVLFILNLVITLYLRSSENK